MVNIDEVGDHYKAVAYVNPDDSNIPSSVAYLDIKNDGSEHVTTAYINAVDPRNGNQCQWDEIKHLFPSEMGHSNQSQVSIKLEDGNLHISSKSDIEVELNSVLTKPSEKSKSKIEGRQLSWPEFRNYISTLSKSKYLFRGQKEPWRLRTSFHRKGRYRISEFTGKDVKQLHKRLSAITSHYFDLNIPDQNGSFFNLLQHHGYPTPLLDWSYSPYVAAFFAFRDLPQNYEGDGFVRVYIFDNEAWLNKYNQVQNIAPPFPHLSVMEFIAIDNPRLVPQQAITTVTNVDDIEAYLIEKAEKDEQTYLTAIDILASEREAVMQELRFMGITAGSMFPSIDGVCEELRELNFRQ
jgi:hypothetical protein